MILHNLEKYRVSFRGTVQDYYATDYRDAARQYALEFGVWPEINGTYQVRKL